MVVAASLASHFATGFGLAATAMAVFGFLAHAPEALSGATDEELRAATVRGGLAGLGFSVLVIVLSAAVG